MQPLWRLIGELVWHLLWFCSLYSSYLGCIRIANAFRQMITYQTHERHKYAISKEKTAATRAGHLPIFLCPHQ